MGPAKRPRPLLSVKSCSSAPSTSPQKRLRALGDVTPLGSRVSHRNDVRELSVSSSSSSESSDSGSELELQLNPDPPEALGRLKVEKWYKDQIRPVENDPGCEARYEEVSPELEGALSETIVGGYRKILHRQHEHDETSAGGHLKLYTHQIRALEAIALEDRNVCICTATSSGKSLAFNLPILSYIDKHPDTTALYLYPTKALAQDQLRVLKQLVETTDIVVTTLDGDCDTTAREVARSRAQVVLTNPDMLHCSLLPQHRRYQRLLGNLKFVVVDECHTYRGSFGSHVANVVRRLRRAFDWHQNKRAVTERRDLRFICCSATIGNPSELMANLTGLSTTTGPKDVVNGITTIGVDADGAPRGPRWVVIWRPSDYSEKNAGKAATEDAVKDKVTAHILNTAAGLGQETSAGFVADTSKLMATLVQMGVRTICFARYRQMVEIMLSRVRALLKKGTEGQVVSYRSGYTQESRRDIEQQIFSHKVLGVICTSALELGVDIGSLDCCISMGYPGSSHSLQQQFGRAGRSGRASLCILVTRETDPIDQWFSAQPERLMETLGQAEDAPVQWDNEQILPKHLLCADNEVEFRSTEDVAEYWPPPTDERMKKEYDAMISKVRKESPFAKKPHAKISLRSIDNRNIKVVTPSADAREGDKQIDEIDYNNAFFYLYPGATYMNQGTEYRIVDLDLRFDRAIARPMKHEYYTKSRDITDVLFMNIQREASAQVPYRLSSAPVEADVHLRFGRVEICTEVYGYKKFNKHTGRIVETIGGLGLPKVKYFTKATWIEFDKQFALQWDEGDFRAALHTFSHLWLRSVRIHLLCDQSDVSTQCPSIDDVRERPYTAVVFDTKIGGIGVALAAFGRLRQVLETALEIVSTCDCLDDGCPKCVHLSTCGSYNDLINKRGAIKLLSGVIERLKSEE
ncbi:hypothetical protein FOZ61_007676 [Perkinsus olseni]|uniref:Uncharacterized protein n=1 Tax=Perkinsus olseni TaxID=32597 RepID=A0A7J6L7U3_PEROL|nr:hypothetical protein FOZ61_007676 [Perkinsus olseni]